MLLGYCRRCNSRDQRFYDTDRDCKHRALKCFTCGEIQQYVDHEGDIYEPPPRCPDYKLDNHPARMSKGG